MKRLPHLARVLAVLAFLALAHAATPGCLRVEHGIVVELTMSALEDGGASSLALDDGTVLTLSHAEITVSDARLLRCTGAAAALDLFLRAVTAPRTAQAQEHHHGDSPFALRGPLRVALEQGMTTLGVFTPPPGRYCGVHVNFGPASDAGEEAPWTVALDLREPEGRERVSHSDGVGTAHLVLDVPLVLDGPGTHTLHAALYGASSSSGIATAAASGDALAEALLRSPSRDGTLSVRGADGEALAP